MKSQSQAVRVFSFSWTRIVVSSASTTGLAATISSSRFASGAVMSATRWNTSPSVERLIGTPARLNAFACRYSGMASAHFATTTCAMKVGPNRALS
jgi:hypothetical protein